MSADSKTIVIRPTRRARCIRGWLYISFVVLITASTLFNLLALHIYKQLFVIPVCLVGAWAILFVLTVKFELDGDILSYSYLFKVRKILRRSEITEAFSYKKPDNILMPTTAYKATTKIMYVIAHAGLKQRIIQIDTSWYDPQDVYALKSFLGYQMDFPLEYEDGLNRVGQIVGSDYTLPPT